MSYDQYMYLLYLSVCLPVVSRYEGLVPIIEEFQNFSNETDSSPAFYNSWIVDIFLQLCSQSSNKTTMGDGGFATNKIATVHISVVYNCQLY